MMGGGKPSRGENRGRGPFTRVFRRRWWEVTLAVVVLALVLTGGLGALPRRPRWVRDNTVVTHHQAFDVIRTGHVDDTSLTGLTPDRIFLGEGRFFYSGKVDDEAFSNQVSLFGATMGWVKSLMASSRLYRMVHKTNGSFNSATLRSGTILVQYDRIYRSTDGGRSFEPVFSFPDATAAPHPYGMSNATARDDVYYGELTFAKAPHDVRVWKGTDDGRTWQVQYAFRDGQLGHIHSIVYDPFRDRLWVGTGDGDSESRLVYTDDDFLTVHALGAGDQSWRISGMIVTERYLYWGTDDTEHGSDLYRYDFATQRREHIRKLGNPVWYGAQLSDGTLVFSASYEPSARFTREQAPPPQAAVWISRNGTDWYEAVSFPRRSIAGVGVNSTIGLSVTNQAQPSLYLSPYGPIEANFTVQRYEIRWR
jgi:hypothetical protein